MFDKKNEYDLNGKRWGYKIVDYDVYDRAIKKATIDDGVIIFLMFVLGIFVGAYSILMKIQGW